MIIIKELSQDLLNRAVHHVAGMMRGRRELDYIYGKKMQRLQPGWVNNLRLVGKEVW